MNIMTVMAAFVAFYLWHCMGVTIGYHRLLSHRSFRCPKIVEYFWVLGGYLSLEGSPIWWVTNHRAHHRYTDQPQDPHSPRFGKLNAYTGWIPGSKCREGISPEAQARDLMKDPIYRFLEVDNNWRRARFCAISINTAFRVILLIAFGWQIALASLVAAIMVQQAALLLINVFCHLPKLGYKNFQTGEDSVNVWWIALLTAGEGWHNNHHAFPGSARSGMRAFEFDLSWLTIKAMSLVGLVQWVREETINSRYSVEGSNRLELEPVGSSQVP